MSVAKEVSKFLLAAVASLAFGAVALAQSAPPPPGGEMAPGMGFSFLGLGNSFGGKVVKGAPYSAQTSTESTQTLADGTHISRKTTGQVYRDGEGRTRRENSLPAIGPVAAAGAPPRMVVINDVVSGSRYMLDENQKIAHTMKSHSGPHPYGGRGFEHLGQGLPQAQTESLGTQTIEGLAAEGTRTTITIPAGQFGNDRPIVIVAERWYSPVLQTVVMSKHTDPRMGETVFRLTNINRTEPAASLFTVPADYTVTEGFGFGRGKMMRQHPMPPAAPPPGKES
jgi:hypothetical protein